MGEPQVNLQGELPEWFQRYVQGQRDQLEAAQANERRLRMENERILQENRSRMVRNDSKPGKALPALLEFYGDADKLEAWLQQAKAKLEVDYYGCTEYVKFWALNGSLRGKALRRMEAWVREQGTPELANGNDFLNRLEFVFRDPQAKERAQRKLENLRQGSKSFLEVFTEWQSLLMESGGSSWPDSAKKLSLDRILSDDLVKAMITVPSQSDFESYCSILKETDDRLRAYRARSARKIDCKDPVVSGNTSMEGGQQKREAYGRQVTRKPSVEGMEWEPSPVKAAATSTKRAKWVSQEERDLRRQTGRCIRCGASGHMIKDCPYGHPQRPVTSVAVRKDTRKEKERVKEVEAELEELVTDESDSEN
jgi:hypothetical protein